MKYLIITVALLLRLLSFQQDVLAQEIKADEMLGSWTAVVEGESRTRTMKVISTRSENGTLVMDAEYAFTDIKGIPFQAKVTRDAQGRKTFSFVTASRSDITVTEVTDGLFEGTIVNGPNYNRKITFAKEALAKTLGLTHEKPGADVPVSCASFFGSWKGRWSLGGLPEMLVQVTKVTPGCAVNISYYSDTRYGTNFQVSTEIKNGAMSFLCNKETNGTCTFTIKGDELWANYSNPSGGSNSGVFKKQ